MKTRRLRRSSLGQRGQDRGHVDHVLDAVDHHRVLGILGQRHEALHPQELGARLRAQEVEEHVEGALADRRVARQAEGADAGVVPVDVVMVVAVTVPVTWCWCAWLSRSARSTASACSQSPTSAILPSRPNRPPGDHLAAGTAPCDGRDDRGARVERAQALRRAAPRSPPARSVFVSTMPVRDRGLPHGLLVRVEGRGAVHRVHHRDHAFERVAQGEIGVVEHRVQDRRRVGEAGGLDHDAPEGRDAAVVALAQQVLERRDEVAAHRAAEAAGGEQDHALVHGLDEEVVEADLAELVDDHDGVGERRVLQQAVEQRGLAGARGSR